MIEKWVRFVVKNRWPVIVFIAFLTAAGVFGLRRLYFYNHMSDWLPRDNPEIGLYLNTSEKFSTNEMVLIMVRPEQGLFQPKSLALVRTLTDELKDVKDVFSISSLANMVDIRKAEDGLEVRNLMDEIPDGPEAMSRFRDYVMSKEMYRNRIISGDGEWAAVSVFLRGQNDIPKLMKEVIIPRTDSVLKGRAEYYFAGMPADTHFVNEYARRDLTLLVPIMVLAIVVILYFNLRSWRAVLSPVLVVLVANIWLFGLIGFLGKPLTIITPAIPVLLIALGSAYGIYVVNKIQHDRRNSGLDRKALIIASTAVVVVPILYAAVTDIFGFLSFRGVPLGLVADFGLFSALGLAMAVSLAVTLIPALASLIDFGGENSKKKERMSGFLAACSRTITRRPKQVLVAFVLIFIVAGLGIPKLKREVGFANFYAKNAQPRKALLMANEHLAGAYPVAVYFRFDDARTPENLRLMRYFENYLLSCPKIDVPFSIVDLVEELNFQMNDRVALPDRGPAVQNLWLFLEGRNELQQLLTEDRKEALVFSKVSDAATAFSQEITRQWNRFFPQSTAAGFVRYDLSRISAEDSDTVRNAEARYLSNEIAWIARHYFQTALDPEAVAQALTRSRLEGADPSAADGRIETVCRSYMSSNQFPFALNENQARLLAADATVRHGHGTLNAESLGAMLRKHVPAKDFDQGLAEEAVSSIQYKIKETEQQIAAGNLADGLRALLPGTDPNFDKRAQSVLYDLVDDLAVLPAGRPGLPAGEPVTYGDIKPTGYPILMTKLADFLFQSQVLSIILAYLITLVLMILLRRSFVLGLVSTIPIIFSSVVMYGLLGFFKIPLDFATMLIGPVSIGVGIDYTIHVIYVITDEIKKGATLEEAIASAFQERGRAIISNTAAVMAGFGILLFSSMVILRNFGGVMVLSMLLCFVGALTVLPVILLLLRPRALIRIAKQGGRHVD